MSREDSPNRLSTVPEFAGFTPVDRGDLMRLPELNRFIIQMRNLMGSPSRFLGVSFTHTDEPRYSSTDTRLVDLDPDRSIVRIDNLEPFTRIATMFEWPDRHPHRSGWGGWDRRRPSTADRLSEVLASGVSFETMPPFFHTDNPRIVTSQSGEGVFLDTSWIKSDVQGVLRNTDYDIELGLILPISVRRIQGEHGSDAIIFETRLARVGFDEKIRTQVERLEETRWEARLAACGDLTDAPADLLQHYDGLYDAYLHDGERTAQNFEHFKRFIGKTPDELAVQEALVESMYQTGRRKLLPTD